MQLMSPKTQSLITALPDSYFKDSENYLIFWHALKCYLSGISRRKASNQVLDTINVMDIMGVSVTLYMSHWHDYVRDPDNRAISHILKPDQSSQRPLLHSRRLPLLQILGACIQFENPAYHSHVMEWLKNQEFCK